MAQRALPIRVWPGWIAAICVAAVLVTTFVAVLLRAEEGVGLARADYAAIRFTVVQAAISALFSVVLAVPLARALSRSEFSGKRWLVTLLGAPFLLPVIVAVMGLLAIFGRNGWVNTGLSAIGLPEVSIYGFWGVILAHVFFNLPVATRLLLQGWQEIPAEQFRLAAQLQLPRWTLFRVIELPMLRRSLPGCWGLIFVVCLTSFAVVLILGGGPRATTIELAIYQAFRFDFDLGRAAMLSLIQLGIAMSACLILWKVMPDPVALRGLDRSVQRFDAASWDLPIIAMGAVFLLAPMIAILGEGIGGIGTLPRSIWVAALRSVFVALASAGLLIALALPIAALAVQRGGVEAIGLIGLASSPLMIGTGAFLVLFPVANPADLALVVTACVNAMMALPFALRSLVSGMRQVAQNYGPLAETLGLRGWRMWWIVLIPRLRKPLGFALGLGAALSAGDLGVIALFADPARATLPLQIEQLLSAYRMQAAASASLLLAMISFGLFWVFDTWGRRGA